MNNGSVLVYYSKNHGFIFASETTVKGSIIHVTMNPVFMANADISYEEIGAFFFNALEKSRIALPVERSEIEKYKFWKCTKITSFSAFSKVFNCLCAVEKEDVIQLETLARAKDGSYRYLANNKRAKLSKTLNDKEAGIIISQLLLEAQSQEEQNQVSFITINGSLVKFIRPSDEFIDIGDGHTDAYQIYAYDSEQKKFKQQNCIAFLIDNNYTKINEEGIRARWEQIYGDLIKFEYKQEVGKIKIKVKGETKNCVMYATFFQDATDLMEIMVQIDRTTLSVNEQGKVSNEYHRLVASVIINPW